MWLRAALTACALTIASAEVVDDVSRRHPDLFRSFEELAHQEGYWTESHRTVTEDGYVLTVHRMGRGKPQHRPPVLLVHGLQCASDLWLLTGPGSALGYLLADRGYDVWLANVRGNRYSYSHLTLTPDDPEFWKFSWHEMAVRDLPATIDYVLNSTRNRQLHYVGHSMGNTVVLAMLAAKPEYNRKLVQGLLLSPVAYIHRLRGPLFKPLMTVSKEIKTALYSTRLHRILPATRELTAFLYLTCRDGSPNQALCTSLLQNIYGWNPDGMNKTAVPFYLSHILAGMSLDSLFHYLQIVQSGRFEAMDRGPVENVALYGSRRPPLYNLTNVATPLILYYGINDYQQHPKGVMRLAAELGNWAEVKRVPDPLFNHIDFILNMKVRSVLYDDVLARIAAASL